MKILRDSGGGGAQTKNPRDTYTRRSTESIGVPTDGILKWNPSWTETVRCENWTRLVKNVDEPKKRCVTAQRIREWNKRATPDPAMEARKSFGRPRRVPFIPPPARMFSDIKPYAISFVSPCKRPSSSLQSRELASRISLWKRSVCSDNFYYENHWRVAFMYVCIYKKSSFYLPQYTRCVRRRVSRI